MYEVLHAAYGAGAAAEVLHATCVAAGEEHEALRAAYDAEAAAAVLHAACEEEAEVLHAAACEEAVRKALALFRIRQV